MVDAKKLLEVENLEIFYGDKKALGPVTFDIYENEIFGIIGPANSGKTSFLRVLNRMDELGVEQCTPRLRDEDRDMPARPWIVDFNPGYMQRLMHLFPKQGDRPPWQNTQDYARDKKLIRKAPLEDGALVFGSPD